MGRSPDGRYLLAMTDGQPTTTLFAWDTVTGETRTVFEVDRDNGFNHEDGLRWMPDSRAFIVNTRGAGDNERALWWVPLDGRPPHALDVGRDDVFNRSIAIHPDGRQIAFYAGGLVASKTTVVQTEFRLLERFLPGRTPAVGREPRR
jgi:hypothetical protein